MKRRVPLKRTRLVVKKPWRPQRARIAARSEKRTKFMAEERVPLTRAMLDEDPWCGMAFSIRRVAGDYADCQLRAIGLHEIRKRSQGGSMLDRANLVRACSPCNSWVEDHPDLAYAAGLVARAGDDR